VVVEAGDAALDQAELVLSALRERGLTLRTVPRSTSHSSDRSDPFDASTRPGLLVLNKADSGEPEAASALRELYGAALEVLSVSAQTKLGLDAWFRRLWELLAMVRVYPKEPGRPADLHKPFVLPAGSTIADLARLIHRDLPDTMKFARLWGHSRFEGQQIHKTEVLRDRDIVEIHE
jgi:hypothetical protein